MAEGNGAKREPVVRRLAAHVFDATTRPGSDAERELRKRQKKFDRRERSERRRVRKEASGPNATEAAQLQQRIQREWENLGESVRDSELGKNPESQGRRLDRLNNTFVARVVRRITQYVRVHGREGVVSALGRGSSALALWEKSRSPSYARFMADVRAQERGQAGRTDEASGARGQTYGSEARTGRDTARAPYVEDSAARIKIGLIQNAYRKMRRPGAALDEIRRDYESSVRALEERFEADGLDLAAVDRKVGTMVAQLVENEPAQAVYFGAPTSGRTHRGEEHTAGAFGPPEPMDADQHRAAMAREIYDVLANSGDADEFGSALQQYIVASATRKYPHAVENVENPELRARMDRTRGWFLAMKGDGVRDQDQRLAYLLALREALEALQDSHGQTLTQWHRNLGPGWESKTQELADTYWDFGEPSATTREREAEGRAEAVAGTEAGWGGTVSQDTSADPVSEPPPYNRTELCRRAGLVDERGEVDQGQLAVMEGKGVSLERAAHPDGGWRPPANTGADSKSRQAALIVAMSEHMANDMLHTRRLNNGRDPGENFKNAARVWCERGTAVGAPSTQQEEANTGRQADHTPWNDTASDTRAREIRGMSTSMGALSPLDKDRMHAKAFELALVKAVQKDPSIEPLMREMARHRGEEPGNWRESAYEAAMSLGQSVRADGLGETSGAVPEPGMEQQEPGPQTRQQRAAEVNARTSQKSVPEPQAGLPGEAVSFYLRKRASEGPRHPREGNPEVGQQFDSR
ncbi:hypothetical protein [Nocardiopsis sp. NPDC006938]|uniref:hypothetical protein n=1 Tax=Nocardiopsis sp. NPDC006938 TaxID=3364337 RepID=UPI00368A77D7